MSKALSSTPVKDLSRARAGGHEALKEAVVDAYRHVRSQTEELARPITAEDAQIQTMPDVSPTKWHLGHTTWFFETFLLKKIPGYAPRSPEFAVIFNSYYNLVGEQHPRPRRGFLSRPSLDEVFDYRQEVDAGIVALIDNASPAELEKLAELVEVGLNHEEQHQELLLTDILHVYWSNAIRPVYRQVERAPVAEVKPVRWHRYDEGLFRIGHRGDGFAFDNETPRHRVFVHAFQLASRLVTAGEYQQFIDDGGYRRPELWLSDGWASVLENRWEGPLYWERRDGAWWSMTLTGMRPVEASRPVCHVSYYEADAYARWDGARLPTEAEWEVVAAEAPVSGNLREAATYLTQPPTIDALSDHPRQLYGDVWEWTQSAYSAYPGFRPNPGALGEYNGKFMCNQKVLRGGSFATPRRHIRSTSHVWKSGDGMACF
jgi:ergothioneine biosynthesis protein EgtB